MKRFLLVCAVFPFSQLGYGQELPAAQKEKPKQVLINKFERTSPAPSKGLPLSMELIEECHTMEADAYLRKKNKNIGSLNDFEEDLQKNIRTYKEKLRTARTQATVYTIPIIVHVIHNGEPVGTGTNISAEQVQSQIDVLNEDYRKKSGTPGFNDNPVGADIEIEFALALRDEKGNTLPEPGIHRTKSSKASWNTMEDIDENLKPLTQWDPTMYLNFWSVKFGGDQENLLGYAQFPIKSNLPGLDNLGVPTGANSDGIVINYLIFGRGGNVDPRFSGKTASHEVGHWLGLRHVWGDEEDCKGNDYCNDTPATSGPNRECPTNRDSCTEPGADMVHNYMDYTSHACRNTFTNEQKARMRTVLENCPRRKELLSSTVHIPVGDNNKPIADFTASQTIACDGATIEFTDHSSENTTAWNWEFTNAAGEVLANFTNKNESITFTGAGTYGVRLIASNTAGKDTIAFTNYITILSASQMTFPFTETAEGDNTSAFPNWVSFNPDGDRNWSFTDVASANGNGTKSIYFDNYSGDEKENPYGTMDGVITNKLDLAANSFAELSFDVAYARYSNDLSDTLLVYYSTDCGKTFTPFWTKGGKDLATAPDTEDNFVPTATQWRKETISLGFLNGNSSVYIAIVNSSGWGNTIYLDNISINIPSPTQKPVAAFTVAQQTVCAGTTVQFNDISQNSPREWNWSFQGATSASSTSQHPSVTYNTPGSYAVTLTAKNPLGTGTITQQAYITVVANPTLVVSADKSTICAGDEVQLTVNGATDYNWYEGADFIGQGATITVSPEKDASYTVVGINDTSCEGKASIKITVNTGIARPTIAISAPADSATVTLTCQSTADAYQWFKDGTEIANATAQTYSVKQAGSYTVEITSGQCSIISDAVVLTSSPEEEIAKEQFKAYPNPVSDQLTLELPVLKQAVKVAVYNSLGMQLMEKEANPDTSEGLLKIQVANFPKGHYFIRITGQDIHFTQSFIKQ